MYLDVETYQVGSHDGVQRLWLQYHASSHGIYEHLVALDIRKLLSYGSCNLVPHDHAVALGIAFGYNCDVLFGSLSSNLESEAHNSLDTVSCEDRDLGGCLPGLAAVGTSSMASVLTLAILADDDPV